MVKVTSNELPNTELLKLHARFKQLFRGSEKSSVVEELPKIDFVFDTPKDLSALEVLELKQIIKERLSKLTEPELDELTERLFDDLTHHSQVMAEHSARVAILSSDIGVELKLTSKQIGELLKAGLLHDIGKLKTPKEILDGKDNITDADLAELRKHPENGAKILEEHGFPAFYVEVARWHHVRADRNNAIKASYPEVSDDEPFPFYASLVKTADVLDASTVNRGFMNRGKNPTLEEDDSIEKVLITDTPGKFEHDVVKALIHARIRTFSSN